MSASPQVESSSLDYALLDSNLVWLVRVLNALPGVVTTSSCGGHAEPRLDQWAEGNWYVAFELPRVTEEAWFVLEFLAWAINSNCRKAEGWDVALLPVSPAPYINQPGQCLSFTIEGHNGEDPNELARYLEVMAPLLVLPARNE